MTTILEPHPKVDCEQCDPRTMHSTSGEERTVIGVLCTNPGSLAGDICKELRPIQLSKMTYMTLHFIPKRNHIADIRLH